MKPIGAVLRWRWAIALAVLVGACPSPWICSASAEPKKSAATRADLAASYLRYDRAVTDHPPKDIEQANRDFDAATMMFFSGNYAKVLAMIDRLTLGLLGPVSPERTAVISLRPRIEPPVLIAGSEVKPRFTAMTLYPVDPAPSGPVSLTVELRDEGSVVHSFPVELKITDGTGTAEVELDVAKLPVGSYAVHLTTADGLDLPAGKWFVVSESRDGLRQRNAERLDAISTDDAALRDAQSACRSRNQLLADSPSDTKSAQFLADQNILADELAVEIETLEEPANPYQQRLDDYWRTYHVDKIEVPMRVFGPPVVFGAVPVPLVIALHGAGGDENMFMDGYGAGKIKQLAVDHGFLLVTPLTYLFQTSPKYFDRLIEALEHDYVIDRDRVYVIGHSLGAMAAASLARTRADQLAGVCCLAGGRAFGEGKLAKTLVIAAEIDPIIPAERIEQAARPSIDAGAPIEFRTAKGFGHTLVVSEALPEAIGWLLEHQRTPSQSAPAQSP